METAGNVGNNGLRARCAVIQLETEEEVSTRQEQMDDKVLKSLSPLINSMRLFGLYFTRHPHPAAEASSGQSLRRWNPARIYATIMLVVIWLNTLRYSTYFDGKETLGLWLFMKVGLISAVLLNASLQTAYYIASHTGSLDRVFRQVTLSTDDIHPKYSRRSMVVTLVCWAVLAVNVIMYTYAIFNIAHSGLQTIVLHNNTLRISKYLGYVITTFNVLLQLLYLGSYFFPQAMKNGVMYFISSMHLNVTRPVKPSECEGVNENFLKQ